MFYPRLPTAVGTGSFSAMGSLSGWEGEVTGFSINPELKTFGFRPFCFEDGIKTWLCEEGQCSIMISQRRIDALAISNHSSMALRNATIHTIVKEGKHYWNVVVDDYPNTLVGIHPNKDDLNKVIDLFSGMTNWSKGAAQLGLCPKIALERDESIASIGAMNSMIPVWKANAFVDHWSFDFGVRFRNTSVMLISDVANEFVREPMSNFKCGLMTGSPPCQPWSILASELGLADSRGRTFLSVADTAEFIGAIIIDLENVAGIFQHPDWNEVVRYFWHRGYALIHKSVDSLRGFLPTNRARANMIFARCDFPHVPIPESLQLLGADSVSANAFGVLHDPMQVQDGMLGEMVQLTDRDVEYLTEPKFFTKDVQQKVKAGLTPLEARAQHKNRALPCPTARYGTPSELSQQTLVDKKLIMTIHIHDGKVRCFSPFECMAALGIPVHSNLPLNRSLAYLMVGNTISPLHVALNLCRAMCCIGKTERSYRSISYIVNKFASKQISLARCEIQCDNDVMWMIPKQDQMVPRPVVAEDIDKIPERTVPPEQALKRMCDSTDDIREPPHKRQCVETPNVASMTHVVIIGQQLSVQHKKFDSGMNMGEFVRTVGTYDMFLLVGEIDMAKYDVTVIHNQIAKLKHQIVTMSHQMKRILPLFDSILKQGCVGDMLSCWFCTGDTVTHQQVSSAVTLHGLSQFRESCIALFIIPADHQPSTPQCVHDEQPKAPLVGVWVRCGAKGDVHQIWVSDDYDVSMLKLRYHKEGFQCHIMVRGVAVKDDHVVSLEQSIIEVSYMPQAIVEQRTEQSCDVIVNYEYQRFLHDPTTIFIEPCEAKEVGDYMSCDVLQTTINMNVLEGHVVITVMSRGWCQTVAVMKGTTIGTILRKLQIQVEAVRCIRYKNCTLESQTACHKAMELQIECHEQYVFVRFNMMKKVLALKIQPYHVACDCKSMLSQHLGIPMSMLRLFHGFNRVDDDQIMWKLKGMIQARVFPLAGGMMTLCDEGHVDDELKVPCVEFWIRSPTDGKLHVCRTHRQQSLQQVHESVFPGLPIGKLYCNGNNVSPDSACHAFAQSVVVSRFFPLKGGGGGKNGKGEGKSKQTNTAKATDFLIDCLEKRGVPKAESTDRAKKVISVVGVDFILKHMESDDFWIHMKNEASKNMVRLILPQELKVWQQTKRNEAKSQKSTAANKGPAPALNPKDLQLRIVDFKAEGKAMQAISEEAIKPDCTGVCLMAPNSAKHFLPAKRLTADGLAIVTLGVLSQNDPQIQFIVTSFSGEEFVARGNMYQFGDTAVTHNPSCPTAKVTEVASSVVEVVIGKDCPWWSVAAVDALAAVSKLDASIKIREAVIGLWKFRPYSQSRVPTNSEHAAHIHGYIRVRDNMLDSILAVSGQHAIFFNTRIGGGGKDDRFSFIPLPDMDLDEAKCKAQTIQFSLGIVKGRGHFTLRCRREHYRKVMKQINPDMVFGESSDDESDLDAKFRLEGIHFQTTAHELTAALKTLNWKAKAIRAMGASAWLVLANAPPKSKTFTLNDQLVVVKDVVPRTPLSQFVVAKPAHMSFEPSGVSTPTTVSQGPVSSRMDQIEAGLEEKIQKIVDKQMQENADKMDRMGEALAKQEMAQSELQIQFADHQKELSQVSTKITNVAADLQTTQANMLSSFEMLLKNEMKSLHQKLSSEREESEEKRRRRE